MEMTGYPSYAVMLSTSELADTGSCTAAHLVFFVWSV